MSGGIHKADLRRGAFGIAVSARPRLSGVYGVFGQSRVFMGLLMGGLLSAVLLGGCARKSPLSRTVAGTSHTQKIVTRNETASLAPALTPALAPSVTLTPALAPSVTLAPRGGRGRRQATSFSRYDHKTGVYASQRVIQANQPVPKGGGNYKLGKPYRVSGRLYVPKLEPNYNQTGTASWYGDKFHGRRTANGETYDMGALSAAHPTMPLPSYAYVTNLNNGRTVLVRVNDRGPYARGRIIDLSRKAANALDFRGKGLAKVRVRYAGRAPLNGSDHKERAFLRRQSWAGRLALRQRPSTNRQYGRASGLLRSRPPVRFVGNSGRVQAQRRPTARANSRYRTKNAPRIPSWNWRPGYR